MSLNFLYFQLSRCEIFFDSVPVNNDHPYSAKEESITVHTIAVTEKFTSLLWYADDWIQDIRVQKNAVVDLRQQINEMTRSILTFFQTLWKISTQMTMTCHSRWKTSGRNEGGYYGVPQRYHSAFYNVCSSISDYFDDYETLEYQEWRRLIPSILEKASGYRKRSGRNMKNPWCL